MLRNTFFPRLLLLAGLFSTLIVPIPVRAEFPLPPHTIQQSSQEPLAPPEIQHAGRLEKVAQVGGAVMDVAVQNNTAYIGKGTRLVTLNLEKHEMSLMGSTEELADIIQGVAVAGEYAYLAAGGAGLRIFNVLKPDTPVQLGYYNTWANSITTYEKNDKRYACLTDGDLRLMDVSDPENPLEIGLARTPGYASHAAVLDDLAYVADGENGLLIVDISQPALPKTLASLTLPGYPYSVAVREDPASGKTYAYLANGGEGGLLVVDVSDSALPLETSAMVGGIDARDLALTEDRLLVANGESGLLIFDLTRPEAPVLQGTFDTNGYALGVAAQGTSAYIADGSGLVAVDFQDVVNPKMSGSYDVLGAAYRVALASQMVEGGARTYAYVADYYSGMYIMDVSSKTLRPTVTGFYDAPGYSNSLSLIIPADGEASALGLDPYSTSSGNRYAFLAGAKNGVRLIDVSSPYYPFEVGAVDQTGFFDDPAITTTIQSSGVQANENSANSQRMAYLGEGLGGGLRILDITNRTHPRQAGYFKVGEGVYGVAVQRVDLASGDGGGLGGAAGEAPAGDRIIAYLAAGTDGMRVVDVSDPQNPFEVTRVDTPASARAVSLAGGTLYIADGEKGGLRILDVRDAVHPLDVGHFASDGDAVGLTVSGEQVFLADGSGGVRVIDVSDKTRPVESASFALPGFTNAVAMWDEMIYTANRAAGLTALRYVPAAPKTFTVTSTADQPDAVVGDGKCASINGDCTLRSAIQEANANAGLDKIEIPSGAYILTYSGSEEESAQRGDLDITDSLILQGVGAQTTVIDGAGLERVFHVGGKRRIWVDISGLTIQNGVGGVNVYNAALFSLRDSIVTRNNGYGLWGSQSNLSIDHCLVSENSDSRYVGGIGSSLGTLKIASSSIIHNSGADGGIFSDGNLTMFDTTVSGNIGLSGAGGMHLSGQAKIANVTIAENEGILGGGLAVDEKAKVILTHTIIAGNSAQKTPDCTGNIVSMGYNLIGNPTGFVMQRVDGDQIGVEAGLTPLAEIDAIRYGHDLLPGSPALDGGNPKGCPGSPGSEVTLDGWDFRVPIDGNHDGNSVCDIGAMESNPTIESSQ